ncbi:MAG: GH3 auxin-responsive promoter family protein, partial [Winogradskyella sp.]|nr:GH3 auxin-responsive promoter family protein [Winogradskyella sp.]
GMLLQLNSGMFYEFVEADHFFDKDPKRITIADVQLGINYVMIISTTAGLWAYNIGDTVEFTCLNPYRVIVSGRIKHFISAFGEHVIGKEVEQALKEATANTSISVNEFTVAPQINPEEGLPYHEWFIEFANEPENELDFIAILEQSLQQQNSYYLDLIVGKVLRPLKITKIESNGFQTYMKSIGKLGGQNKIPRLSNDRIIADQLYKLHLTK